MSLTLTLREPPAAPLEVPGLRPDMLAALTRAQIEGLGVLHGNRREQLGDHFVVAGDGSDDVRIEGDLRRVHHVGAGMQGGRLRIAGSTGDAAGAQMRGGELIVEGDAGDRTGVAMRGGWIDVRGSAGAHLGGPLWGDRAGMTGGEILVHGSTGAHAGEALRRGLIAVGGDAGPGAGLRMLAGTIVSLGALGEHAGAAMRRGTIVAMTQPRLLPTFALACVHRPAFLGLVLRRLRELGLPVADEQLAGRYARWSGDGLDLRRGEILVLEAGR